MTTENSSLIMKRETMAAIPEYGLPAGYEMRGMSRHDIPSWLSIWRENEPPETIPDTLFEKEFGAGWDLIQPRCLLLFDPAGLPIGTVSAWLDDEFEGGPWGRIHWIAVVPGTQGKGLGRGLLSSAMERLKVLGHERCYLLTHFKRHAAIKLYLQFGFKPVLTDDEARAVWNQVCAKIGVAGQT